jgi:cardiolipin synthase
MGRYRARDLLSVPGLISLARLPLATLFPVVVENPPAAIAALVATGLTDVLDGWYARRFGQATPTGAVLDPLTDKVFMGVVVVTFLLTGRFGLSEVVLLAARDIGELPLIFWWAFSRSQRRRKAGEPRPNLLGKLSTTLQFFTIGAVIIGYEHIELMLFATAATGVCAAALYWARELPAARSPKTEERNDL